MNRLTLMVALVLGVENALSASIPTSVVGPEENIKANLIGYESGDSIEGLTPPEPGALNHFNVQARRSEPENPYVVEISRDHLKIKTTGFPAQKIKLTQAEAEGIQKLSLSIVELLNSSKLASQAPGEDVAVPDSAQLNPVIVLTNSGISLRFLNVAETEPESTETPDEHKQILWDFLTKYAKNIFEEKLKELKLNNKFAEVVESLEDGSSSPFEKFTALLLRIMTFSVNYAETAFQEWTTPRQDVTAAGDLEKKTGSTAATLFAFAEPSPFHELPSDESQFRRKDVDAIFYGRGVI